MLAKLVEIRVPGQPSEIAVAQSQRLFQSGDSLIKLASESMTTREIVKDKRVAWLEPGQLLVHSQAVVESATLGVMVSQDLQCFQVLGIAVDEPFQERDFDVQIASFPAGQPFAFGTAFFRHTTAWIVPKREAQVKCRTRKLSYLNARAYLRKYFTATVKSFGHGEVMLSGSLVTG